MDLGDRLLWMLVGCIIGFILGYFVRALREIKETVDHVDEAVTHERSRKNEKGSIRIPTMSEIALFVVVALAFWAAISSQRATNEVTDTQNRVTAVAHCNQTYLSELLAAANERTSANSKAAQANVQLQTAWYNFVTYSLHQPPHPEFLRRAQAATYAKSLRAFLKESTRSATKTTDNPYPTDGALEACINRKEKK